MIQAPDDAWSSQQASDSRKYFQAKQRRLVQQEIDKKNRLEKQKQMLARVVKTPVS
jgi:hypothetical protein